MDQAAPHAVSRGTSGARCSYVGPPTTSTSGVASRAESSTPATAIAAVDPTAHTALRRVVARAIRG